jgi:hypothetical protein
VSSSRFNTQNLRGQALLFRCLETGFVTTAPALTRYQQGRGIDPGRREFAGNRPENWSRNRPVTVCARCGVVVKGNQWAFRQHQATKRCKAQICEKNLEIANSPTNKTKNAKSEV